MATFFSTTEDRVIWQGDGETLIVQAWGRDSVRVRSCRIGQIRDHDWALLVPGTSPESSPGPRQLPEITVRSDREAEIVTLRNGELVVTLTGGRHGWPRTGGPAHYCRLAFSTPAGRVLFEELDAGGALQRIARNQRILPGGDVRLIASFVADPQEKLYGMGLYQDAAFNLKGSTFELAHRNSQVSVPFVLSSAGYGFLWHNPAIGRATFASNRTEWCAESTDQLDYWVTAGDTPAAILGNYADATGHSPIMPEYGLGFWQCKLRYWNQEQLLGVAREHHSRGLPLDVIVADFFHWPKMGDYRFEDEFWPDPSAMVAELKELGVELMVSVWPQVSTESENYMTMRQHNLLLTSRAGLDIQMTFEGPSAFVDVTSPAAREFLLGKIQQNYGRHGIHLFWLDEAEPEFGVYEFDQYHCHAGSMAQVGAIYPQLFARAFHDARTAAGEQPGVNLVRAAWAGSQRYGALVWSGDIGSSWSALRAQIPAGLHLGIAGIPWFTSDIGGFAGGNIEDPAFHELLIRWFQFGTFCPVMRLHGDRQPSQPVTSSDGSRRLASGAPNELWSYGEEVYQILRHHVHLRERLRPYLRSTMAEAHRAGVPVMRPLLLEFPDDPNAWQIGDQYLLGSDLLVAPVTEPGARQRELYLPAGASWIDPYTGRVLDGGQWIVLDAPLERIPVLVRHSAGGDLSQLLLHAEPLP